MTDSIVERQTAKVYQFPRRGRFASSSRDESIVAGKSQRVLAVRAAGGGAWYHDEAIADERQ